MEKGRRAHPDRIDTEILQVWDFRSDPLEITYTIPVCVGEGACRRELDATNLGRLVQGLGGRSKVDGRKRDEIWRTKIGIAMSAMGLCGALEPGRGQERDSQLL